MVPDRLGQLYLVFTISPAGIEHTIFLAQSWSCGCRGRSDQFTVEEDADLGDLSHVTVGHDSAGNSPSWHLEALVITHESSGRQWRFSCDLWFDSQQGDGLTQRDLFPVR